MYMYFPTLTCLACQFARTSGLGCAHMQVADDQCFDDALHLLCQVEVVMCNGYTISYSIGYRTSLEDPFSKPSSSLQGVKLWLGRPHVMRLS